MDGILTRSRTLIQTLPTSFAALDLHFSPHDPSIIAVATSTGSVCFCRFKSSTLGPSLECFSVSSVFDHDILTLSLAWDPLQSQDGSSKIAVSLSNGTIAILEYDHDFQDHQILWQSGAHSLEAWTVAYTPYMRHGLPYWLYSGGDDGALCIHKLLAQETTITCEATSRDIKAHLAGVTAVVPLPILGTDDQEILLTGSYDDHIRIYNTTKRPRTEAELYLGGGVWKLKLLPGPESRGPSGATSDENGELSFRVLASCMHAGVRVLNIARDRDGKWSVTVLAKFEEHESMNYASDVQLNSKATDGVENTALTCVSTSFYDKKLCVWTYGENGYS